VLAAPGLTETLRFTPTSPAGGALTGDYPNPELAPDSVATAHIQAGAVTGSGSGAMLLASGGEPAIAPGAIGGADIADNAITTPKLANGAVTAAKQAIAVGGVLAGTLPNPTHAPGDHTFTGGLTQVSRDTGAATPYLPHLELYTPNVTNPGAAVWLRFRSAQGWATAIGAVVGSWWHAFADSTGAVVWGWDGSKLKLAAAGGEWVNLTMNGVWTSWDGGTNWNLAGYRKAPDGFVHLRGLIRSNGSGLGSSAATLPVGFRPAKYHYFAQPASGAYFAGWYVQPDGQITLQHLSTTMGDTYFSLAGITFPAEQ
jgi:hypothetical protein